MITYAKTRSNTEPMLMQTTETKVFIASNIKPYSEVIDGETVSGWEFDYTEYDKDEYIQSELKTARILVEKTSSAANIAFVVMAESGTIDEVTATEHLDVFSPWTEGTAYAVGNLRTYEDVLYKCIQAHTSQVDWTPDKTPALWKVAGDPTVEYPDWSQPIGAQDAYMAGDKVTYDGERWISAVDNNVWNPGVYGWERVETI